MLASTQYSASMGMPTPQASGPSYHVGPHWPAPAANSQDGASFASLMDSEFSGAKDGGDSVR